MKKETIRRRVLEFLSLRQVSNVDCDEEELEHFIAILVDCAEYVMEGDVATAENH